MCILCTEQMKKLTIKEKLNGLNEMITTEGNNGHFESVHNKLLKEYAEEIGKQIRAKQFDELTFQDYVETYE